MSKAFCIALACVTTFACGVPITVRRVQPTSDVEGVRYTVLRPSYHGAIYLDDHGEWRIRVEQKLDQPVVFEAKSRVNPLAATELSFTLKDDGTLSGIMGGETDKTLETIQAAVGLAKAVGAGAAVGAPGRCAAIERALRDYETDHAALRQRARGIAAVIARTETLEPSRERLEHLAALRDELEVAESAVSDHVYAVPSGELGVTIDGGEYVAGAAASCVQIHLQKTESL